MNSAKSTTKKVMKMISVDEHNYNELRMLGHVPESFNTVIRRLISEHHQRQGLCPNVNAAGAVKHTK